MLRPHVASKVRALVFILGRVPSILAVAPDPCFRGWKVLDSVISLELISVLRSQRDQSAVYRLIWIIFGLMLQMDLDLMICR